jgi:hypothetical protein
MIAVEEERQHHHQRRGVRAEGTDRPQQRVARTSGPAGHAVPDAGDEGA